MDSVVKWSNPNTRMDRSYAVRIDALVDEILTRSSTVESMPMWGLDQDEQAYNEAASNELEAICMDRKLIYTALHPRGIEACDIFLDKVGACIHVKKARDSASVSHLLAQALVATDSLVHDSESRRAFTERVNKLGSLNLEKAPLNEVVIAIGSVQKVTSATLFTFSKVNLVRQVRAIESNQVRVRVAWIALESSGG